VENQERPTPFDLARAEAQAGRDREMGNVVQMRPPLPAPHDRLPTDRVGKAPPQSSPYWTERAEIQRKAMIERLGVDRVAEAAKLLHSTGEHHVHFGQAAYASVFEHNCLTLATALACAEAGLRVVDLHGMDAHGYATGTRQSSKIPRGAAWQLRATNDRAEIIRSWQGKGKYPVNNAGERHHFASRNQPRNLGIATGGDIVVVDFDGEVGLAWLAAHATELPDTVQQTTGSGGRHKLYRLPMGVTIHNTASQIAPGVDIRGDGGQIVAGPSLHATGNFYIWDEGVAPWEREIADAPAFLIEEAQAVSKKSSSKKAGKATGTNWKRDGNGDVFGFEAYLETIGDGAKGFDAPIYAAACAWFSANGSDSDDAEMIEELRTAILEAPCDDGRNESRYATDAYLFDRVEQARNFIADSEDQDDDGLDIPADADSEAGSTSWTSHKSDPMPKHKSPEAKDTEDGESASADGSAVELDITGPLGDDMDEACGAWMSVSKL